MQFFDKSEKKNRYIIDMSKESSGAFFVKSVLRRYPDCMSVEGLLPFSRFLSSQIVIVVNFQQYNLIEGSVSNGIVMALPLRSISLNILFRFIQVVIYLPLMPFPNILIVDNIGRSLPQLISFFFKRFFSKVLFQLFSSQA